MRAPAILALVLCLPGGLMFAGDAEPAKPEKPASSSTVRTLSPLEAEIVEAQAGFISAFNKGDVKLLAGSFTEDADWIDDQGAIMRGRAAIERALEDSIAGHKGRTLTLRLDSVRTLSAAVVVGNSTSGFAGLEKVNESAAFIAIYVKKDGKWLISVLTETSEIEEEE